MISITLTEEEKRQIYLLDGMAAGIMAARDCLVQEMLKKRAPPPPPSDPPKE